MSVAIHILYQIDHIIEGNTCLLQHLTICTLINAMYVLLIHRTF